MKDRPLITLFDYKPFSLEYLESKTDEDLFNLGAVAELGTEILKKRGYSESYIRNEYIKRANPFMLSYMRGTEYNERKLSHSSQELSTQNGDSKTVEIVANEYGVSKNTISRDAQLTNSINKIAETSQALKNEILQGEANLTKQEVLEVAKETPEVIQAIAETPKEERKQDGSFHISAKNNDWYTPEKYIEASRLVMGSIDVDPATSELAQKTVKAKSYYTKETNGLDKSWNGNVWMNPPYSMPEIQQFIDKLINEDVDEWIVLTNNSSDTGWFHKLLSKCDMVCFTKGRINFVDQTGTQGMATRQGQTFFYKGNNHEEFIKQFKEFGAIMEVLHEYAS